MDKWKDENSTSEDGDLWIQFIIIDKGMFPFPGEFNWLKKNIRIKNIPE